MGEGRSPIFTHSFILEGLETVIPKTGENLVPKPAPMAQCFCVRPVLSILVLKIKRPGAFWVLHTVLAYVCKSELALTVTSTPLLLPYPASKTGAK